MRPEYEQALNEVSAEIRFWNEMERMMEGTGQTFRPEIEVARSSATAKIDECAYYFDAVQPDRLRTCIGQLQSIATKLGSLHRDPVSRTQLIVPGQPQNLSGNGTPRSQQIFRAR